MKKKTILIAALLLLSAFLIIYTSYINAPEYRAAQFVDQNGSAFSALAAHGQSIPATLDGIQIEIWSKEHTIYEFLLGTGIGDHQYWGVYYSPDDVPVPFQNADVILSASDDTCWTWQAEGNNHGTTKKLTDQWYYFEASF